jgi:hypothetical protein
MNVAKTFVLSLVLLAVCSCAIKERGRDSLWSCIHTVYNQILVEFEEDCKAFNKEYEAWSAKAKNWKQREYDFINSLPDEELQAYSEFRDTYNQDNWPKHLIARRKFTTLLDESWDNKKLVTFKGLVREGGELIKQSAYLDSERGKLEKRQKQLAKELSALKEMERKVEEDRRYRQMLSAIERIGFSLDSLRQR